MLVRNPQPLKSKQSKAINSIEYKMAILKYVSVME